MNGNVEHALDDLISGKMKWQVEVKEQPQFSCPVLVDGKVLAQVGSALHMFKASPDAYTLLGKANVRCGKWTSPAFNKGRVFLRGRGVLCYNLVKQ